MGIVVAVHPGGSFGARRLLRARRHVFARRLPWLPVGIGVEIEDPFGTDENDLPLERICSVIQANILALVPGESPQAELTKTDA